jgi:hypothetical protein
MCGFLPLPWFLFWVTLGGFTAPGYSALAQHASELTLLGGWPRLLLDIAAIGSGLAFMAFALGLWRESGKSVPFGALAWLIFGISMLSNGLWVMGSPMHGAYSIGVVNIVAPAISQLESSTLRTDRKAYIMTVFVSISGIMYLWMNLTGHDPELYRGLTQRLFSSINSLWPAFIAYRLYRLLGHGGAPSS